MTKGYRKVLKNLWFLVTDKVNKEKVKGEIMKNCLTKKECDIIIQKHKDNTAFFGENGGISYYELYDMLRWRMGFGEAETMVIIASLVKAGAKIPTHKIP